MEIVRESNRYFDYTMIPLQSHLHRWKETTVVKMYLIFATIMLMLHVYKHSITSYMPTDPSLWPLKVGYLMLVRGF